jgi:hypothetical protein
MSETRLVGPTAGVGKWQGYRSAKRLDQDTTQPRNRTGIQAIAGRFVPRVSAAPMCGTLRSRLVEIR